MSEPREEIIPDATQTATDIINEKISLLEEDIDILGNFQEEVEALEIDTNNQTLQHGVKVRSNQKSDTEKVIDLYKEHFFDEEEVHEEVETLSRKFDLSMPAADFLAEMTSVANINDRDALQKIQYLDSSNSLNPAYKSEVVGMSEYPRALRREVIADTEAERNGLRNYREDTMEIVDSLDSLNRAYTNPMDVDDAIEVLEELENFEDRVDQLKDRREHELRRRPEIFDGYMESNLEEFYDSEEFDDPVLYDLKQLEDAIGEAYDNIMI